MKEKCTGKQVFYLSLIITAAIALWALAFHESFTNVSNTIFGFLTENLAGYIWRQCCFLLSLWFALP